MTHAIALPLPARLAALTDLERVAFGYLADYEGNTRTAYEYHLNAFLAWCHLHGVDPLTADRTTIALYVRHLSEERGLRGSTVNTAMTPVKGFYRWAMLEGFIDRDPVVHTRLPKVDYRKKYPLDREELRAIRRSAKQLGGRHWALGELLIAHAFRISECCDLLIENCQDVERGHRVMRVRRKGGKIRTVPMPAVVAMAIDDAAGDRTEGPVLVSIDGYKLHRSSATGLLNTVVRHSGVTKHVNPHLIRASVITTHLDGGGDIREGQRLADHEDPRTTSRHYDLSKSNHDTHPVHIVSARLTA
ncbi:tyrosine-type recombinase/integrase [Nocardioides aquiterrae]|uniref:Integrase n=1 Tax=Nocardioides aquiterrae TaxID=203799 RepID=A0ABP4EYU2_9ACTN